MMAEFQEVMNQWRRFCKSHSNCGECEFDGKGICGEAHLSSVPCSDIELRIMAWAAEHPVVYPTWLEWLKSMGVIPYMMSMVVTRDEDGNFTHGHVDIKETALKPIPADIAQKLGIEPKNNI